MIMLRKSVPEENGPTRFVPGQLVRHRRYGYRGLIVEADLTCQASNEWYGNNQTQPNRDQPWYHVLVHGSAHVTYAAQENLEADPTSSPIAHPLVAIFFEGFFAGAYKRNERPWDAPS